MARGVGYTEIVESPSPGHLLAFPYQDVVHSDVPAPFYIHKIMIHSIYDNDQALATLSM